MKENIMLKYIKYYAVLILVALFVFACSTPYPIITVEKAEWRAYTNAVAGENYCYGNVDLSVSGNTEADRVTVMVYGDGYISEVDATINDGTFSFSENISFTPPGMNPTTNDFRKSTEIRAYRGNHLFGFEEVTNIQLTSPPLNYYH